jgi:hypothetical protein
MTALGDFVRLPDKTSRVDPRFMQNVQFSARFPGFWRHRSCFMRAVFVRAKGDSAGLHLG